MFSHSARYDQRGTAMLVSTMRQADVAGERAQQASIAVSLPALVSKTLNDPCSNVAAFENEFDIEMEEDAALQVKTVDDAVKFIQEIVDVK